jgi:hypothetical protein
VCIGRLDVRLPSQWYADTAAKKVAMTVPAAPAAVRIAWAGLAPEWRAVIPAAKAAFRAPDKAKSKVRICVACI